MVNPVNCVTEKDSTNCSPRGASAMEGLPSSGTGFGKTDEEAWIVCARMETTGAGL